MNGALRLRWPKAIFTALLLALFAFAIFGPLANLLLWAFAERWYFPSKLPAEFGFTFWQRVFNPRGNAVASLVTSVWIAVLTVVVSLAVAIPAGYALGRLKLPWRSAILLLFLLPQAVPNLPIYVNIARVFYEIGLNGTIAGVVLDVFEQEPLPTTHPFWKTKNLLMTFHTSAPSFPADIARLFNANYARYRAGQPLNYQVNFARGY